MKKAKTQTVNYDKLVFLSLLFACVGLMALYMYFVSASIVHVVIRKEIGQDMVKLNSEISELESEYIAAQHALSNQIASLDGYEEISDKIFIDRNSDSLAFSQSVGQ